MKSLRIKWDALLVPLMVLISCVMPISPALAQFLSSHRERQEIPVRNSLLTSYALTNAIQRPVDTIPMLVASASSADASGGKSVFLAAALSLVIPGLGEYYVGDHIWRGMIFTGLEAGLWVGMIRWQQRYNDSMVAFRSFSDAHWSTPRYADSLNASLRAVQISDSCDCYATGSDYASINRAEAKLDSFYSSNAYIADSFGHRLFDPSVNNQQYYEMISKYPLQYLRGWDNLANFNEASFMRADAQHQADISNDFLFGIFLNHVLSAIDAAILARDHNSPIHLHGDILERPYPDGTMGFVPTANIEYRF